jgi:hypothetical protein
MALLGLLYIKTVISFREITDILLESESKKL